MNWPHYTDPAWVDHAVAVSEGAVTPCEPPLVSPGLYVAKRSARRCTVVSVSNWTVGYRWPNDSEIRFRSITSLLKHYERA